MAALDEPVLHDEDTGRPTPSERLLQQVWLHQRLRRDALRTLDGRPVTVLHPGFWNRESGPDFRGAVLQIGDDAAISGDVEVDLSPAAWRQHGHDRNPAYQQVRLHVVWRAGTTDLRALPTLELADLLDAPLDSLRQWLGGETSIPGPVTRPGGCAGLLHNVTENDLRTLLEQAATSRLRLKAEQLAARARQAGWDQALWEAAFAALGYKHNAWPLRRLGELRSMLLANLEGRLPPPVELQARLFGVAGLLPAQLTRRWAETDRWLRRAWDVWWRWRDAAGPKVLPELAWRFDGLRPANHPQRRLALAAHWLARPDWPSRFEPWLVADLPRSQLQPALARLVQAPEDPFWSWHWTLQSGRMKSPRPLLGASRIADLAMNAVLPWLWSRAAATGNRSVQDRVESRYQAWPAANDNAVLKLARARLLAGQPLPRPVRACHQQGLLQIVRDFCDHANALCECCRFPALVAGRS